MLFGNLFSNKKKSFKNRDWEQTQKPHISKYWKDWKTGITENVA